MSFESRQSHFIDLGFNPEAIPSLRSYVDLLWTSNKELNLVSRKMTFDELIDNHVIDCLLPLKFFPKTKKEVADFGSGGGLPGVIYAIQFPKVQFQLFEKSPLKRDFLNRCKAIAPNIEVMGDIPLILKDVDLVVARGFKPLDVILQMSRNHLTHSGRYFLLKARREKIDHEIALAQKIFKDLSVEIQKLQSPVLEVERNLVSVRSSKDFSLPQVF